MRACPSCAREVSEKAFECPGCGEPLRKAVRGFFGRVAKWSLIGFNLLMIVWLVSYGGQLGGMMDGAQSDAEQAGTAIGGGLGVITILFVWAMGSLVLGLWALLTRPKR